MDRQAVEGLVSVQRLEERHLGELHLVAVLELDQYLQWSLFMIHKPIPGGAIPGGEPA